MEIYFIDKLVSWPWEFCKRIILYVTTVNSFVVCFSFICT